MPMRTANQARVSHADFSDRQSSHESTPREEKGAQRNHGRHNAGHADGLPATASSTVSEQYSDRAVQ